MSNIDQNMFWFNCFGLRTVIPIAKILIVVMFARHLAYLRKMLQAYSACHLIEDKMFFLLIYVCVENIL